MSKENYYQQIEDYVNGALDEKANKDFESEVAQNEELAKEVAFYKKLNAVAGFAGKQDWKNLVEKTAATLKKEGFFDTDTQKEIKAPNTTKETPVVPIYRRFRAAAGFLLILVMLGYGFQSRRYSNDGLSNRYEMDFMQGNFRGADRAPGEIPSATGIWTELPVEEELLEAREMVLEGRFPEAMQVYESVSFSAPKYNHAQYALGILRFGLNDYEGAWPYFDGLEDSGFYKEDKADWLAVVAMLRSGATSADLARKLNAIIDAGGHSYEKQARALQKDLGSLWRKIRLFN